VTDHSRVYRPATALTRHARRLSGLLLSASLLLGANGCATFWDEAFSRERDLQGYFRPPDPLLVIRDSTDGERRGKAMASLQEPLRNGGTQKDQDVYLEILTTAARTDRDPFCRLGAIQGLSHFKDPKAAQALIEVYEQGNPPFTAEFNTMIRQQALRGVEKTGDPEKGLFFVRVARMPGPAGDAPSADRQATQDEKLIAIRALAEYKQPECLETLVYLLEREKDAALRDRAHQSLQLASGKQLPPDAEIWRASLAGRPVNVPQPSWIERAAGWLPRW
jgi:hypothetical protein